MNIRSFFALLLALAASLLTPHPLQSAPPPHPSPPPPAGATPAPRQLAWQDLEFYGFLHFSMNTFTDKEWGYGDENPSAFNPTDLDARQWAQTARDAGMKGLIITAKHHDGFCLWPSQYTEHSVKNSPWRNGQGDVLRELSNACREFGLNFGVYLSPWDRNRSDYATPAYLTYYRNQLRELLTHYGPVFEVWFDGANGGDGYYGGARETRRIDNRTYYDWPNTWSLARKLQPTAVMFSDAGPDIRWVGNERGVAFETSWYTIDGAGLYPGRPDYPRLAQGSPTGANWIPPEVDVSIRPGWFYHPAEDNRVKSLPRLLDIYYESIGRGANLLLNVPPDRRGRIHQTDVDRLVEFRKTIDATFQTNLALGARASASNVRGNSPEFAAGQAADDNPKTYWATDDDVTAATLELDLGHPMEFDRALLAEPIALGQRIEQWSVEAQSDENPEWKKIASGTTVGRKRIARFPALTARRVRVRIDRARACPALTTFALYRSPK